VLLELAVMARVLVADDDPLLRGLVSAHLRSAGHQCIDAVNGHEAIALARSEAPDIVLLDHMMPQGDGPSVLRALRAADGRRIPVIMLTARTHGEDKVHAFDAGADDYVVKPFHFGELQSRIDRLLRQR
jgi:DNA-binding response OmpR family regulator